MTSRTVSGWARSTRPSQSRIVSSACRRVAQVGLEHEPGRRAAPELVLAEQLEDQLEHRVARVHRLHVDVQVGAELVRAPQQRAQAVGGVLLAAPRRVGPQQRRQRRHLHRQVRARQRAGAVALELRPLRPLPGRRHERVERVGAAVGVALRLGLGHRRLAEQVDRGRHAVLPQVAQHAERRLRVLADDEAVRHVLDAGRGRGAERGAPGLRAAHPHRDADRRRRRVDLAEEAGQVPREVVEVAAGGHDVDEAEQRRLELGVLRGEVHRLLVERLQRVARDRHRGREALADLVQLALECALVHHVREHNDMGRQPELVSVAAPMHDEEATVEAFHARVTAALDGVPFELVIVDDGSRDGTGAALAALAGATSGSRSSRCRAASATRRRSPPRSSTAAATSS